MHEVKNDHCYAAAPMRASLHSKAVERAPSPRRTHLSLYGQSITCRASETCALEQEIVLLMISTQLACQR